MEGEDGEWVLMSSGGSWRTAGRRKTRVKVESSRYSAEEEEEATSTSAFLLRPSTPSG
jgi:hypothetical protein